ncbi:GGDEF domain-containing protein [Arsenicicoccus sp. oral taxon 190]|uniref:GGDEF domain-containing protein n=1 Tax=Arsenicicoccus sp. oral taxon 190 TaxID=1658671 RepID=UPI00067A8956|nr:GGDEF domain-containing protein [Arsenicicoccus sp. oral taxon 190]
MALGGLLTGRAGAELEPVIPAADEGTPARDWHRGTRLQRVLGSTPPAIGVVTPFLLLAASHWRLEPTTAAAVGLLTVIYLVAFRSPFKCSVGGAVPTQPILVAALLTCPLALVPVMVLVPVLLAGWIEGKRRPRSFLLEAGNAVHALAPVGVLWGTRDGAGIAHPSPLLLVAALGAQVLLDGVTAYLLERPSAAPVRLMLPPLLWTWQVDALLAVLGWAMVTAVQPYGPLALVLTGVPIVLVRFLASDRETHLARAIALRDAYAVADAAARCDPLTGAANRLGWEQVLAAAQATLATSETPVACTVLCADLDRLKLANDIHGHHVGDQMIADFATLLRDCAPPDATVARLGGDEFAVAVVRPVRRGPVDLITPVREALLAHRTTLPVQLSASLGQAEVRHGRPISEAVTLADLAARRDKAARRMNRAAVPPELLALAGPRSSAALATAPEAVAP